MDLLRAGTILLRITAMFSTCFDPECFVSVFWACWGGSHQPETFPPSGHHHWCISTHLGPANLTRLPEQIPQKSSATKDGTTTT